MNIGEFIFSKIKQQRDEVDSSSVYFTQTMECYTNRIYIYTITHGSNRENYENRQYHWFSKWICITFLRNTDSLEDISSQNILVFWA